MDQRVKKNQLQPYFQVFRQLADYYGDYQELHRDSPTIAGKSVLDSLIATMLTQATTDRTAIRAFNALKERFPRWQLVMASPDSEVEKEIAVAGLARQKTRHIRAMLEKVCETFDDYTLEPLRQMDSLEAQRMLLGLPGVGPKTAACVLAFALERAAFPVDTHVHRILQRLGWSDAKMTPIQVQSKMQKAVPAEIQSALHIYLIHHGRTLCRARTPNCTICPIRESCKKLGV
ncbi:MAG TPA: endonuclease III [Bacillota bacterium]|nr:endonuclease III [Bacillota bacterium]